MIGALLSRAASSEATTVDEEVQFCGKSANDQFVSRLIFTYDGRDGELLLLGVLEELQTERLAKILPSFWLAEQLTVLTSSP
jgi:hypothetical protein